MGLATAPRTHVTNSVLHCTATSPETLKKWDETKIRRCSLQEVLMNKRQCELQKVTETPRPSVRRVPSYTYITLHYIALHLIPLHSITLHSIPLHSIPFHYITYIHMYIYIYTVNDTVYKYTFKKNWESNVAVEHPLQRDRCFSMGKYGKIIHKWWEFPAIPAGIVPYLSSGPPSGGVSLSLAKREASCG